MTAKLLTVPKTAEVVGIHVATTGHASVLAHTGWASIQVPTVPPVPRGWVVAGGVVFALILIGVYVVTRRIVRAVDFAARGMLAIVKHTFDIPPLHELIDELLGHNGEDK
ncbi:MAG: hypothetical protein ACYDAZ_08915 [Thermoplasmataceae archaeon]